MALGIGFEPEAGFGNRALLADAGEHVGERAALGMVIEHVVGGDERRADVGGELVQGGKALGFVAAIVMAGREICAPARGPRQPLGLGAEAPHRARAAASG